MDTCEVPGCDLPAYGVARYCRKHVKRGSKELVIGFRAKRVHKKARKKARRK
jgi:hypothetical protein